MLSFPLPCLVDTAYLIILHLSAAHQLTTPSLYSGCWRCSEPTPIHWGYHSPHNCYQQQWWWVYVGYWALYWGLWKKPGSFSSLLLFLWEDAFKVDMLWLCPKRWLMSTNVYIDVVIDIDINLSCATQERHEIQLVDISLWRGGGSWGPPLTEAQLAVNSFLRCDQCGHSLRWWDHLLQ